MNSFLRTLSWIILKLTCRWFMPEGIYVGLERGMNGALTVSFIEFDDDCADDCRIVRFDEFLNYGSQECRWHQDQDALDEDEMPSCPECQRLLSTKVCEACHLEFLDWEYHNADDVCASPCATSSGDLACSGCIQRVEREIDAARDEEDERDYAEQNDDYYEEDYP